MGQAMEVGVRWLKAADKNFNSFSSLSFSLSLFLSFSLSLSRLFICNHKLVVNLFNAPNALSGKPTAHSLLDAGCCALASKCMSEALSAFDAAKLGCKHF